MDGVGRQAAQAGAEPALAHVALVGAAVDASRTCKATSSAVVAYLSPARGLRCGVGPAGHGEGEKFGRIAEWEGALWRKGLLALSQDATIPPAADAAASCAAHGVAARAAPR